MKHFKGWIWIGLGALSLYWWSVGPSLGTRYFFAEDMCSHQMARQFMGENLAASGQPQYFSDKVMAPFGTNMAFFAGWNFERDFIGGLVWNWNRDLPFLWLYFGVSLLIAYFGVGGILRRMGLSRFAAWMVATAVVGFNLPRHFKLWHHADNIMMHWVYLGFFWDALIWHRAIRERRWTLSGEAWRGLGLLLVCWTMGYFWGPSILEWACVRVGLFVLLVSRRAVFEMDWKKVILPLSLIVGVVAIDFYWFLPLLTEAKKFGLVNQEIEFFANGLYLVRPLWLERILGWIGIALPIRPFYFPETPISVGWALLSVLFSSFFVLRKKRSGPGWGAIAPFLVFWLIAVLYAIRLEPVFVSVQYLVPFMTFFRTASRFGYFMPILVVLMGVLLAPEFRRLWDSWTQNKKKSFASAFLIIGVLEISWLAVPVYHSPQMPSEALAIAQKLKELPGSTVLSLPFCVAGANGVCTEQQCKNYPYQMMGMCLRPYHDKKVYGVYSSRLSEADCRIYDREPYSQWFSAWREKRCFRNEEWEPFCRYLEQHPELSAILLFPEIWGGGGQSEDCVAEFAAHLGAPFDQAWVTSAAGPGQDIRPDLPTRMIRFAPKCQGIPEKGRR